MIYIPTLPSNLLNKDGRTSSFTLQFRIDPKKIIKKYDFYNFSPFMNEFSFVDEKGVEYLVCIFKSDNINSQWATVVTVFYLPGYDPDKDWLGYINPEINNFFYYLSDNFGMDFSVDNGDSYIEPGKHLI